MHKQNNRRALAQVLVQGIKDLGLYEEYNRPGNVINHGLSYIRDYERNCDKDLWMVEGFKSKQQAMDFEQKYICGHFVNPQSVSIVAMVDDNANVPPTEFGLEMELDMSEYSPNVKSQSCQVL